MKNNLLLRERQVYMLKNIIKVLTIILTILVLMYKAISNMKIKKKKEIKESNKKYINKDKETSVTKKSENISYCNKT